MTDDRLTRIELREKQARLGALTDASRDDVLAGMDFACEHRARVASTTPTERVSREIERRSHVIGIFRRMRQSSVSWALMPETNDERTVARRYMSLESFPRVTGTTTVRLSAVATCSALELAKGRRSYTISRGTARLRGDNAPRNPGHGRKSLATRRPFAE